MRKRIYQTVHIYDGNAASVIYKWFMIAVIVMSLIPLTSKQTNCIFELTDRICVTVYIIDYILRWITADYKFGKHHYTSFVKYPFRFISVVDLMSIFALVCPIFGWFKYSRFTKILTVIRIVRIFRYSKNVKTILDILKRSKKALLAVGSLAIGYILVSALIVFNVEPQTFDTFFDAVYWSTISLTTVGYGDIYTVSVAGKAIAMISSFFGIAVVALPAGVVTAEYVKSVFEKE